MNEKLTPPEDPKKSEMSGFVRALSEPLSKYGWPVWLVYTLAVIGVIYLLNPTAGILEFLPDNLPYVGNLDESVAVMLVLSGIVEALEGKKYRQSKKQAPATPEPQDDQVSEVQQD